VSEFDPPPPQIVQTVATWAKRKQAVTEIGQGDAAESVDGGKQAQSFFFYTSKNES